MKATHTATRSLYRNTARHWQCRKASYFKQAFRTATGATVKWWRRASTEPQSNWTRGIAQLNQAIQTEQ